MRAVEKFLVDELRGVLSDEFLAEVPLREMVEGENEDFSQFVLVSTLSAESVISMNGTFNLICEVRLVQSASKNPIDMQREIRELRRGLRQMFASLKDRIVPGQPLAIDGANVALCWWSGDVVSVPAEELFESTAQVNLTVQEVFSE